MEKVVESEKNDESSVFDALVELLPFEMHLPGHEFCGPGTNLEKRLKNGDRGISKLDSACREHDIAYAGKGDKRKADQKLVDQAFSRMLAGDTEPDERTAALVTACCMVSKITFERCFNKITRAVRKRKNKNKKFKRCQIN